MNDTIRPPEIPDEFFEEIGRLCTAWAFLEYVIEREIHRRLNGSPETLDLITSKLDAKGRWELLCQITKGKDADAHAALKAKTADMTSVTRDRNLIVHGLVKWNPDDGMCWAVAKGAYAGKAQPASVDFVSGIRKAVQDLAYDPALGGSGIVPGR